MVRLSLILGAPATNRAFLFRSEGSEQRKPIHSDRTGYASTSVRITPRRPSTVPTIDSTAYDIQNVHTIQQHGERYACCRKQ